MKTACIGTVSCVSKVLCKLFFIIILFSGLSVRAQLADFTLGVTVSDETCNGNGRLDFTVANTTPGSSILYSVYLEPDITNSISSSQAPFIGGLFAGTYTVIALQTQGDQSNWQQVSGIVINNSIPVPLQYDFTDASQNCGNVGQITVNILSGTATLYEIISGPVTLPPQASNVFTQLPEGSYNIKVYDECGQGFVTTHFLDVNPAPPVISPPTLDEIITGNCTTVNITNTVSYPAGTIISYPLTVTYTIHPPDGSADIVETQTYTSGAPSSIDFVHTFPITPGQVYTYDLLVVNGCNMQFGVTGQTVDPHPSISATAVPIPCGLNYLTVAVSNFSPPYTVNFTSAPAGFNPVDFNPLYPGPFTDGLQDYGGEGHAVPEGTYNIEVTDACGRTASTSVEVHNIIPVPTANGYNNGCFSDFGFILVSVPDRRIVSAILTSAPATYTHALPEDVSSSITPAGTLRLTNMPKGQYTIDIVDECGRAYTVTVIVPDYTAKGFTATPYADCNIGIGSGQVSSQNGKLVSLTLTAAPAGFIGTLPLDVSGNIDANGTFYMDNLVPGDYTFTGTDVCGVTGTASFTITGYQPSTGTPFTFLPFCNAFNIAMSDADTSSFTPTYWLQMENPLVPGQWVNPATGVVYPEGTFPDATNSVALINGQTNYNFQYQGTFRIVKAFQSVGNGSAPKLCFEVLGDPFEYRYDVIINNVYRLGCGMSPDDVYVDASGLAPLHYFIVEVDGQAVTIDNGTNSIFTGLASGVYKFKVVNDCGADRTITKDINLLPNLVDIGTVTDMLICTDPGDSEFQEFDLSQKDVEVLNGNSAAVYTITYYASQQDLDNHTNSLPDLYTNVTNPQTIYVRMVHNYISVCDDTASFVIQVSEKPQLHMNDDEFICTDEGSLQLVADAGFDDYSWSTGQTTRVITVHEPGTYTVTVTKNYLAGPCTSQVSVEVHPSEMPQLLDLELRDWTEHNNSVTVVTSPGFNEFSLDGVTYQDSNVFNGLDTGIYTVYVRDKAGCGQTSQQLALMYYPNFFTPNGDGTHETWRIQYSWFEPDLLTYIYDRFGKLITYFQPNSEGWDGNFNGHPLPSTDYWFVVKRHDGQIHKGHFSLVR